MNSLKSTLAIILTIICILSIIGYIVVLERENDLLNDSLEELEFKITMLEEELFSVLKVNDELSNKTDELSKTIGEKDIIIEELSNKKDKLEEQINTLKTKKTTSKPTRSGLTSSNFTATAYDLSVASCGKSKSHPQYGITRSGYNLSGHSRSSAMTIAVDPKVIPMGSKVKVEFPNPYEHFNGTYIARDTGSAIKGNIIDIFMGEDVSNKEVMNFGRRKVKVTILE